MASISESLLVSSEEDLQFECDPCKYEGDKRGANFFCQDCIEYLCDACKLAHQKLAATRKHQVVSKGSMPLKRYLTTNFQEENEILCTCNDGKKVTVYCKFHNKVICLDCKKLKHRRCESLSIEQACVEFIPCNREQTLQQINELIKEVRMLKIKRSEDMDNLTTQADECRTKVKSLRREVNDHFDELEYSIDAYETTERETLEQHLDTCNAVLATLQADCQSFEATTTSNKHLVFIRNLKLTKQIGYVTEALSDMAKEDTEPKIVFKCDQTLSCTVLKGTGTVQTNEIKDTSNLNVQSSKQVNDEDKSVRENPYGCIWR